MSVFHTPNRWCDSILRSTRILLRAPIAVICLLYKCGGRRDYIPGVPGVIPERFLAAQTVSGEPAVPGIIPGGVASCPYTREERLRPLAGSQLFPG